MQTKLKDKFIEVSRAQRLARFSSNWKILLRIYRLFSLYKNEISLVFALILLSTCLSLLPPLAIRAIFDNAIPRKDIKILILYSAILFVAPLVVNVITSVRILVNARMGQAVIRDIRRSLFSHMQEMPLQFYMQTSSGDIQSRLINDVNGLKEIITNTASSVLNNFFAITGSLIAMAFISPILTTISFVFLPVFFIITHKAGSVRRKINRERQEAMSALSRVINETLSINGILLVKMFGRADLSESKFDRHNQKLIETEIQQQWVGRVNSLMLSGVTSVLPSLIYMLAGWQLIKGQLFVGSVMTAGTLVAFISLQGRFFGPAAQLLNLQADMQAGMAFFDRIFEYLDLLPEVSEKKNAIYLQRSKIIGKIVFDNVSFSYKRHLSKLESLNKDTHDEIRRPTISGVSFVLPAGCTAALVGPSGAGKTTIAYLLSRLYEIDEGIIAIDGYDVKDITRSSINSLIGYVAQEPYLLHASIRDNILYARPNATEQEMIIATKAAAIHDKIMSLEDGYDTVIGERGYRLSGGERQRIAISRAILKDPPVLILDEATSALDSESESLVQEALSILMKNRTTIVIAHRLSTIKKADLIFVMNAGKIAEAGQHLDLIKKRGLYYDLYCKSL